MRYRHLMELFEQAVPLPEQQRSTLLAELESEEPALAVELRALLAQNDRQGDTLDSLGSRIEVALTQWSDALSLSAPGTELGEDTALDPLLGGDIAARYRLDERLGIGGMGRVYRAFDRVEARFVAIKLLHARLIRDVRQIQRFRREFRVVSRLSHPGCLSVLAEGCHQEQRYIVAEYVPGGNLGRLAGAPDDTLLPVLIKLAEALDYVHSCRILHRDLKPANVLLTAEEPPLPKLADFGIVQMLDETETRLTDTGAMVGSLDFMAPEQFQGRALDPRCDLYSLGCIIYSLWAGQPPFVGTPFQRMWGRFEREAPRLRELAPRAPDRLDALVARLLQRDRDRRPQLASEVACELSRVLEDVNGGARSARSGPCCAPSLGAESADRERTFHHLRQAGLTAFDAHDYDTASRLLDEAIEQVDSLPADAREAARIACTESLADALISLGRTREGIDRLRQLTAGAAPIGTRVRWMRKLGVALLRTPDVAEGLATLEGALSLLGDEVPRRRHRLYLRVVCDAVLAWAPCVFGKGHVNDPVSEEQAVIHRELAIMHRWIDLDRAGFHTVAFIRIAYRLGIDAYVIEAYIGTAFLFLMNAWPRLGAFFYDKARELSQRTNNTSGLVRLEIVRAGLETFLGRDADAAASCFAEGLRVAESLGDRFLMNFALSMRGWAGLLVGYTAQAAEDFRRAEALAAKLGIQWLRDDAACGQSMVNLLQGNVASALHRARGVLTSDTRLALPVFEGLPNEILGGEAFVEGRFREAISYFERAREHYSAHRLERAWGTLSKLLCSEALICLLDEEGARAAPDLLQKLRDIAHLAQRHYRGRLFRGCSSLLNGVYRARCGKERTARALFARARAERGEAPMTTVFDIWVKVRVAFEHARLGDPSGPLAVILDEADAACLHLGLGGMRAWLLRMRAVHRV